MELLGAKDVEACRKQLLQLKEELKIIQGRYRRHAEDRIGKQRLLAKIVQTIQNSAASTPSSSGGGGSNDDDLVNLVEETIIHSLASETEATKIQADAEALKPNKDKIDQTPSPARGTRTKSAEDAVRIYRSQIDTLDDEMKYRIALEKAEQQMSGVYQNAIDDIVETVDELCSDQELTTKIKNIAKGK